MSFHDNSFAGIEIAEEVDMPEEERLGEHSENQFDILEDLQADEALPNHNFFSQYQHEELIKNDIIPHFSKTRESMASSNRYLGDASSLKDML
jgi:hypothetical protein